MSLSKPTLFAIALALLLALTPTAAASLDKPGLQDDGRWVFSGTDFTNKETTKQNDPMTMLWMGGPKGSYYRSSDVKEDLSISWPYGHMTTHKCLGAPGETMWLRYHYGHKTFKDDMDLSVSTSGGCKNQWHSRLWNDAEVNGPNAWIWMIGGIHRETKSTVFSKHKLRLSFEAAEVKALHGLKDHCQQYDWRGLPGSGPFKFKRSYGSFYSDGRVSRLAHYYVAAVPRCRGAFH